MIQGVFDYDYAPCSEVVGTRRMFLNISQEGKDDIDDLREADLISGLKVHREEKRGKETNEYRRKEEEEGEEI